MQDSGSLAVFKVTARDQGHYKGPSGAFVTYCNISCLDAYLFYPLIYLLHTFTVIRYRHPSTISNFSETTGPIETKFHIQPPGPLGKKKCSNGLGHMTKMAAMSIYGKNLKNLLQNQ